MTIRTWQKIALAVDTVLRPLGLILWITYDGQEDERGLPIWSTMRVVGVSIKRRPKL